MSRYRQILDHIGKQKAKIIADFQGDKLKLAELVEEQVKDNGSHIDPQILAGSKLGFAHIKDEKERAAYVLFKSNCFHDSDISRILRMDYRTLKGIIAKWSV